MRKSVKLIVIQNVKIIIIGKFLEFPKKIGSLNIWRVAEYYNLKFVVDLDYF